MKKADCRRLYDRLSAQLDASPFGRHSFFMNYGYVSDGSPDDAASEPPPHAFNRSSMKLVLEVIGASSLGEKHILDVGCGRGGTAQILQRCFAPACIVGVDVSPCAVAFSASRLSDERTSFLVADAERLPFRDSSFDVVINIESSHNYPNAASFFGHVFRVLRPGGLFLYADVLPTSVQQATVEALDVRGLKLESTRDITRNVLLACRSVAASRMNAFDPGDRGFMQDFLATPGSTLFERMQSGECRYVIARFRKLAAAGRRGVDSVIA